MKNKNILSYLLLLIFLTTIFFLSSKNCSAALTKECKNSGGQVCGNCNAFEQLESIGKKDCTNGECCVTVCGPTGAIDEGCTLKENCIKENTDGLGYCKNQDPNKVCCEKAKEASECDGKPDGYRCQDGKGKCFDEKCETNPGNLGDKCGEGASNTLGICKKKSDCEGKEQTSGRQCSGNNVICCQNTADSSDCEKTHEGKCITLSVSDNSSDSGACQVKGKAICYLPLNPCESISGSCSSNCKKGYKKSDSNEANGYCNRQKSGDSCCVKSSNFGETNPLAISYNYKNPLKVDSITKWLFNLLASIQGIVGWLAIIMIFIGGIMYILSGGSQNQVTLAKGIIIWALIGFGLAVTAPAVLKEIKELANSGQVGASSTLIDDANSIKTIVTNVLKFLFSTVGILALLSFAIGGIMYLISLGNGSKTDSAKKIILYSIVAIAVSGSGIIVLKFIISLLEANLKT